MCRTFKNVFWVFLIAVIGGCASMPSDFEEPVLTVSSIAFRNSNSITPRFDIQLHITNPNRDPLKLQGMSYTVNLAGNKVVTGVANDLPEVPAYGEADMQISAEVSLFGSIRLLNELMTRQTDQMEYAFEAKLDVGRMRPRIKINHSGSIALRGGR